jgi:hypothetical protein
VVVILLEAAQLVGGIMKENIESVVVRQEQEDGIGATGLIKKEELTNAYWLNTFNDTSRV